MTCQTNWCQRLEIFTKTNNHEGRHQSCFYERIEILSDSIECNHSSRNTSSLKVVRMETGEVLYEKVYISPRPPPKISLKHEWKRELVSEHAQRSEVGQLPRSFQSNQPTPNPTRERTWRPVVRDDARTVQDERKRPVLRRSMLILLTKNLFLQRENGETRY